MPNLTLVGQYDSPFVRRVAVALNHYGFAFDRQVLSTFAHFEKNLEINPLGKVPTLLLDNTEAVYDSRQIIEYLETLAPFDRRLTPVEHDDTVAMLQIEAIGIGLAEKVYERGIELNRRTQGTQDVVWMARLERQIASALGWLANKCADGFLVTDRLSRADLAVCTAATFLHEKLPQLYVGEGIDNIEAHRTFCENIAAFKSAAYSQTEAIATGWRPETPH